MKDLYYKIAIACDVDTLSTLKIVSRSFNLAVKRVIERAYSRLNKIKQKIENSNTGELIKYNAYYDDENSHIYYTYSKYHLVYGLITEYILDIRYNISVRVFPRGELRWHSGCLYIAQGD